MNQDMRTASSFDLSQPGIRVAGSDRDWAFETANMLSLIQDEFARAVASWSAFSPIRLDPQIELGLSQHLKSLRMVYAREFVLSLDSINKILSKLPDPPEKVVRLCNEYDQNLGAAKHIRDSFAHIEDRGRGLAKSGAPIPSSLVVLACFVGDRFELTASDGKRYGIEISDRTLALAKNLVQGVIDCYSWE